MFDELIDILGFLGALGDYSYIDRLGNAIDESTMIESLKDAIRMYHTVLNRCKNNCYEVNEGEYIVCVRVEPDKLEESLNKLLAMIASKPRIGQVKLAREIATKSYARLLKIRNTKCGGGST